MRGISSTKIVFGICAVLWIVLVLRVASDRRGPDEFVVTIAQPEIQAFARQKLSALQARSFSDSLELCGIIFEDEDDGLITTPITDGDEATCDITYYDEPGMAPVASFHTHGAYGAEFDSEVPSVYDLESDFSSEMDGYISTPGGRFWRVDWENERAVLICGEGCLPMDPNYRPCPIDDIAKVYTIDSLQARSDAGGGAC